MEHPTEWLTTSSVTYDPAFFGRPDYPPRSIPMEKKRGQITLEHDIWIGRGAYIRGGVTIGTGAIIGANAVVTKDVPPYAVVVGNPGRIVKYRFSEEIIKKLIDLGWWWYDIASLPHINPENVEETIATLSLRHAPLYDPPWLSGADFVKD